jgi:type IV pilus assembly protein PilB
MEKIIEEQPLSPIARFILQEKLLSKEMLIKYQRHCQEKQLSLLQCISSEQPLLTAKITRQLSEYFGLAYLDLDRVDISEIPQGLIDENLMQNYRLVPILLKEDSLFLATDNPYNQEAVKEIQFHKRVSAILIMVETQKLDNLIKALLNRKLDSDISGNEHHLLKENKLLKLIHKTSPDDNFLQDEDSIVRFLNDIIYEAITRKASDIHFELYEKTYRVRYRQDGLLVQVASPDPQWASRITARIKIMSNLDISERRIPQDGRFKMALPTHGGINFRVSICPTINGEKVVIRVLDSNTPKIPIAYLGFNAKQQVLFLNAIRKPQGLILVTGPTGSGKTVSLYSALNTLNTEDKNILTAEDPVEINLPGINQVHVNPKVGLTFATVLRSLLRQDPDIIMIGEIRDIETAEIALKAAQTGHLVFSTLHSNSAVETLTRLANMGLSTFNIATSISLLIAQRLVRRLCNDCKVQTSRLSSHSSEFGEDSGDLTTIKAYRARGCTRCAQGYRGQIGLFEVMPISKNIERLILSGHSPDDILKQAQLEGMQTLYESGLEKVRGGITSFEEVNRVTM